MNIEIYHLDSNNTFAIHYVLDEFYQQFTAEVYEITYMEGDKSSIHSYYYQDKYSSDIVETFHKGACRCLFCVTLQDRGVLDARVYPKDQEYYYEEIEWFLGIVNRCIEIGKCVTGIYNKYD